LFHGFDTLGSPLEGRRVPWLRRETCPLASHKRTLIQLLTVNTGRPVLTDPGPSWPGSVAPSLPWVLRRLCILPPPFVWFWRCHPRVQDGGSLCMKSGLLRFNPRGCSYVALQYLPPLEVISSSSWTWTRLRKCSFELVMNPSFMPMYSYINTTLPNACT
jgi:hypothetical protein